MLFQDLGGNGYGGIDGVTDNGQDGFGAVLGTAFDQGLDNTGVGVEEIVTRHARFTRDPGRNDHDTGAGEGGFEAFVALGWPSARKGQVTSDFGRGGDLRLRV